MASDDEDVPESGAVFTFGKTRFADNLASKFWIRDDPVVQVACGDEHSAIITAKGKLYTFGSNDWGQLGHGNTKPYNKPSVVKKLKPEKSYLVACGRNHTLVATESGKLYSFGSGGEGQLGHEDTESSHEPKAIDLLDSQHYSLLACGSDFSAAVTKNGILYTWGSASEGQNGLGEDSESPKRLYLSGKVVSVSCGYYHMAVVTDDGSLYTCGEQEGGKLGLEKSQMDDTSQLQKVESIKEKVTDVSCGSEFTVAVTENGHVYAFGQGNQGQLGLGPALTECEQPEKVQAFNKMKAKSVECGESFTAVITKHGNLYTFGDGRHGKLGLGDECFSNLFQPQKVSRFNQFIVKKVSCGGCHMLVSAVRKEESFEELDSEEEVEKETLGKTLKPGQLLDAVDGPSHLSSTWSARDKRRQKHVEDINNSLSHSLPPINKSSLPPLNGTLKRTLPALGKANLNNEEKKPVNPLDASRLPKITHPDEEGDQSTPKSQPSPRSSPKPLPRGQAKPLAAPRPLPRTKKEKEETESEEEGGSEEESDEEEERENGKSGKQEESAKKTGESIEKEVKKQAQEEEESEEDEEEEGSETEEDDDETKHSKPTTAKEKTPKAVKITKDGKKKNDEEEDDEESEEEEEEEDDNKNKYKSKRKFEDKKLTEGKKIEVRSSSKKGEKDSEEEEEDEEEEDESEEDEDAKKKKKKKKTKKDSKEVDKEKKKKGKKKSKDEDKDEEPEDDETTEESTEKTKKGKKKGKKKEETKEDEEEEEDDEEDKEKEKEKPEEDKKEEESKNKESTKNAAKQKDKKSGICVLI